MIINKIHILTSICLMSLLLSGCNNTVKKNQQSNNPTQTPQVELSGNITDAEFAFMGENVWISLNSTNQDYSPNTEILHSSNNGQTWLDTIEKNLCISSMQFVDSEHGWAIGNAGPLSPDKANYILSTKDGGKSWSKTDQTSKFSPNQIQFLNEQEGFIRVNNMLLYTVDGGQSWKQKCSIDNFMSFNFKDNKEGWASNLNSILHTTDGGQTWVKEWSVPEQIKKGLELIDSKIMVNPDIGGWAIFFSEGTMAQTSKIILHMDKSNNWTIESGYNMAQPPFSGNPAPNETGNLDPVSDTSAFLLAIQPTLYPVVLKTNDQGKTWSKIIDPSKPEGFPKMTVGDIARIDFVNDQLGWGIIINRSEPGNKLKIIKTENSGAVWKAVMQK